MPLKRQLWALRIRGSRDEYKFGLNENYLEKKKRKLYENGQCSMEAQDTKQHQLGILINKIEHLIQLF